MDSTLATLSFASTQAAPSEQLSEMFNHDKWIADDVSRDWEKVDVRWYSTAMSCTSNRGTPN